MYLSVIIPAWNEEKRIGATLQSISEYLARQTFDAEVIVVNNRSSDRTADVVRGYMGMIPRLQIIDEPTPGKGVAVRTGMLAAKGQYRLFMDADNATTIDHFDLMMPYFSQGYDVVIGSIAVKGTQITHREPLWRVLLGKAGNKWIQVFAVWGISDTQRGFKAFSAAAVERIFPKITIFKWGFDIEVLALARKFKFKIKEIPVRWQDVSGSKVNPWTYIQVLIETLKIFWNLHTGVYR